MKSTRIIRNSTLAPGLTVALSGISFAAEKKDGGEKDHVVPWAEVLGAVQVAVTAERKGGKVEFVEE